jgi:diguanylate cyclase (GGDEF)-like protein
MNDLVVVLQPDPSQALRLQQILFELGVQSVWVETGEKALKIFETMGPPRMLLMEPSLPDMDGFAVLKKLRAMAGEEVSPAMVVSSFRAKVNAAIESRTALGIGAISPSNASAVALKGMIQDVLRPGEAGRMQWVHPDMKSSLKLFKPLPAGELKSATEKLAAARHAFSEPPTPSVPEFHSAPPPLPPTPPPPPAAVPPPLPPRPKVPVESPGSDLVDRLRHEVEALLPLVSVDLLTGLANHRAGEEAGRREASRARRTKRSYAVMAFDLFRFKEFNERRGFEEGDRVLKTMARIIGGSIRNVDVPVRWSGDRFMVILADTGVSQARRLAGRILRKLSAGKDGVQAKVCVGVADSTAGRDFSAVISAAEEDLKRNGDSGGDPAVYVY